MNERINYLKTYILDKQHHSQRRTLQSVGLDKLSTSYALHGLSPVERATACFAASMDAETPVILPGERIVFTRTSPKYRIPIPRKNGMKSKANIISMKKVRYVTSLLIMLTQSDMGWKHGNKRFGNVRKHPH